MNNPVKATSVGIVAGLFLLFANMGGQYLLWFGDQGLVRWRRTHMHYLAVREDVRLVDARIQRLKAEILLLEKEPTVLEEVARRDLGMVYPDEILFIFPKE